MRLPNQIRAVACTCWIGVLGLGIYSACEADLSSRAGVIREGSAGGTRLADPGAQDALSRTRTELPHTGESRRQSVGSPGHASESPRDVSFLSARLAGSSDRNAGAEAARSQSVSSRPLPVSSATRVLAEEAGRGHLRRMATDAANLCGVPPALFHALISRESSWRPHVVSNAGAVGLAQVKPSTGREVSRTLDVHDPWQNLVAGACYLRKQFARFGTWRKALHAYRLGPNARVSIVAREYASDIIEGSAQ